MNPKAIRPDADGGLLLPAARHRYNGSTLILEKQHGNLGLLVERRRPRGLGARLPKDGTYSIWLVYACDESAAGNTFVLRVRRPGKLPARSASTKSWDSYTLLTGVGRNHAAGRQARAEFQSQGPIRGALLD